MGKATKKYIAITEDNFNEHFGSIETRPSVGEALDVLGDEGVSKGAVVIEVAAKANPRPQKPAKSRYDIESQRKLGPRAKKTEGATDVVASESGTLPEGTARKRKKEVAA